MFTYPGAVKKPEGKLRWLYESAPLAFLIEQAGGRASTGTQEILDVVPEKLHERTPLIIGSKDDVALVESFVQQKSKAQDEKSIMARSRVPQWTKHLRYVI